MTEFGCALMHKVAPSGTFHFINKLDRVHDIVFCLGQGLVVDEACFWCKDVDDLKGLLYPKKGADVACRNKDGFTPRGVPRIFNKLVVGRFLASSCIKKKTRWRN